MNFAWTDEQQQDYDAVVEFAKRELSDEIQSRDLRGEFAADLWKRCAAFGVLGWAVDPQHGGSGKSITDVAHLMEGLGYGCSDNGLTFALGAQMWGVMSAVTHFGSAEQIARYVPAVIRGDRIGAFGMTEEGSGSDAFSLDATARRDGDSFVLNGEKVLITFAPIADFAVVFAQTDPDKGKWGLSAFLLDADTPGYTAHPVEDKMGLRTVPFGRAPDMGLRPERQIAQFLHLRVASIFTVGQRQTIIMEYFCFCTHGLQQSSGFLNH